MTSYILYDVILAFIRHKRDTSQIESSRPAYSCKQGINLNMALAQRIIKAIKVKMLLNRLSAAKENALRELMGLPPKRSW